MAHDADQLIDTLTGLLRDFGRHSFDLERQEARKTATVFDQWAQHLLTGVTAPGQKTPSATRSYGELRQQFLGHRKLEQSEFRQGQDALRDIVWMFVSSLNREVTADRQEDAQLSRTLSGVTTTLQAAAPADIRRLALEAVKQVEEVLASRRERQQRQVADLAGRLESLGTQLEVARRESTLDGLTQLFNRKAFDQQLERTVELAALRSGGVALLIIDIDHFKTVNDTWGHPAGDAVIRAVAQACVRVFKRKTDFVARYGGEELVALVREVTHAEAMALGERVRESIASLETAHEGQKLRVTASTGVASWERGETGAQWLSRADAALYRAKSGGRNRVDG